MDTIEFEPVPRLESLLPTLRAQMPELTVQAVRVNADTIDYAKVLTEALAAQCGVDVHLQSGQLCYGPVGHVSERNLTVLVLWRLPVLAAYRWGYTRKALPDLDRLGQELEESIYLQALRPCCAISLYGTLKVVDEVAESLELSEAERDSCKRQVEQRWLCSSGGRHERP